MRISIGFFFALLTKKMYIIKKLMININYFSWEIKYERDNEDSWAAGDIV